MTNNQGTFKTSNYNHNSSHNNHQEKINNSQKTKQLFVAQPIARGFFANNQQQNQYYFESNQKKQQRQQEQNKSPLRKRKQIKQVALTPLQNEKKTEVFQNINYQQETTKNQLLINITQQIIQQIPKKQQKPPKEEGKKQKNRQLQQIIKKQTNMHLFYQEDENQVQKTQQAEQNNNISIKKGSINHQFIQQSNNQQQHIYPGSEYFTYGQGRQAFKKQIFSPLKNNTTLQLQLIRDKGSIFTFWPQFHLHFSVNSHYIMSAKKTSSKPTSTFIISSNRYDFQQNSPFYLGKIKSNLFGNVLNIFGPGLNPSNAKSANKIPRQLLASIVYESSILQTNRPRFFRMYVKKPEINYYTMPYVKMYEDQVNLYSLYHYPQNKDKIDVFYSRVPEWNQNSKGFTLNFRGRVQEPSIKNFILEFEHNGPDLVIFGKLSQQKFAIDISGPISPYLGFAVALSTFDSRIFVE